MTQSEFTTLWKRIGATDDGSEVFGDLRTRYSEPQRYYHNLQHIGALLREFSAARTLSPNSDAVEAAIWFHDAIYDPKAKDNEERSAELAAQALRKAGVPGQIVARVRDLILATKHNTLPADADAAVLVDADLSILGKPPVEFDYYEDNIRKEYAWVSDADFRNGRAGVLQSFLDRARIYTTDHFGRRYEAQASENMTRSLKALRQPSDRRHSAGE